MITSFIEILYNKFDLIHAYRIRSYYSGKNIDLVIDVGSHKGEFINLVCSDDVPIYSIEPQFEIFCELKTNTSHKNVLEYFNFAVSSYDGVIDFYINNLSSTSSTVLTNEESLWIKFKKLLTNTKAANKVESVKVFKLETLLASKLEGYNNILLKIDVEGAESQVLLGALNILKEKKIKYIQIEESNYDIYQNKNNINASEFLKQLNFILDKKIIFPLLNFSDLIYIRSDSQSLIIPKN